MFTRISFLLEAGHGSNECAQSTANASNRLDQQAGFTDRSTAE